MKSMEKMERKEPKSYLQLPYARILIREDGGDYSAEILEFPGCFAVGQTPNEAIQNLEEIAESWIESMLEQGQEIPPPSASQSYSGRFALRLPKDLHRLAARKARRDGVSLNKYFVTAIAAWVGADNLFERVVERLQQSIYQLQTHVQFRAQTPNSVVNVDSTGIVGTTVSNTGSWSGGSNLVGPSGYSFAPSSSGGFLTNYSKKESY